MSNLTILTLNLLKARMKRKQKITIINDALRSERVCPVILYALDPDFINHNLPKFI